MHNTEAIAFWHSFPRRILTRCSTARPHRAIDSVGEYNVPLGAFASRRVRRIPEGV